MPARLILPGRETGDRDQMEPVSAGGPEGLPEVKVRVATQLDSTQRGDEQAQVCLEDAAEDDLVEITFERGVKYWVSVAGALEDLGWSATRGGVSEARIPPTWGPMMGKTRGESGAQRIQALRVLQTRFPKDLAEEMATLSVGKIARMIEEKLAKYSSGLYHFDAPGGLGNKIEKGALVDTTRPYLLFLHGTASSSVGSFEKLGLQNSHDVLKLEHSAEWEQLRRQYPERMLGFEHLTFSESPIQNARTLVEKLPTGGTLHLLTHSRGGLVGELLCLGQLDGQRDSDTLKVTKERLPRLWMKRERWKYRDDQEDWNDLDDLISLLDLLKEKQLKIEKFVRVACPVRGTIALSDRLDHALSLLLNLLETLPVFSGSVTFQVVKALFLELIKRRADPRLLPGIEAMMPSSPLVYMLNNLGLRTASDLAVIAGDIEGSGLLGRMAVFLTDCFYQEDHDLVVNCAAMTGGLQRQATSSAYLDRGHEVNHFNYFRNLDTRSRIVRYLTAPAKDPQAVKELGFTPLTRGSKTEAPQRSPQPGRADEGKWTLFLLPGMMGSQLWEGDRQVWPDPAMIGELGIPQLEMGRTLEAKELLPKAYDRLIDYFEGKCRVVPFAYDWRQSIEEAARQLAEKVSEKLTSSPQPVRFLAHSAGGLVVRAMIALDPGLWRQVTERGGRLLMLGTPNRGSYWVARLLAGEVRLVHQLAMLELERDEQDLPALFRSFPGILELLPEKLLHADGWSQWKPAFCPDRVALDRARRVREMLTRGGEGQDRSSVLTVAGSAAATPSGLQGDRGSIVFLAEAAGDGRVTHEQARVEGGRIWYVSASHGNLADHPALFPGFLELLERGETRRFSEAPPRWQSSKGALDPEQEIPSFFPTEEDLVDSSLGRQREREETPVLHLSVLHADLRDAMYPVMVGHYREDAIVGAEAAIDRQLGMQLSRAFQLGIYPGAEGTVEIFDPIDETKASGLKGAIVLGLGEMGQLTREKLRVAVTTAAVRYALKSQHKAYFRGIGSGAESISLSTLLLGTYSNSRLSVREAVQAIVQGVVQANRLLESARMEKSDSAARPSPPNPRIEALEIVELYEDMASQAIRAVKGIVEDPPLDLGQASLVLDSGYLITKRGGRPQRPADLFTSGWWRRIKITVEEGTDAIPAAERRLRLTVLSDRARVEEEELITQRKLIDQLVERATLRPGNPGSDDPALSMVLFDLMVPPLYKDQILSQGDLVLVLDGEAANYPWELMASRTREEVRPIARGRGMIRQLVTDRSRPLRPSANSSDVLVIGDPKLESGASQLEGARREAEQIATLLKDNQYDVKQVIQEDPLTTLSRLFERDYRIIHLAGHGHFDAANPTNSGLMLGEGLWLGPAEFRQLRTLPDLVFLNCCHLGTMERRGAQWNRFAASLSQELIEMGVKAVVAAGWAIDDQAALTFAEVFYRQMLQGKGFGEAVKLARDDVYSRYPQSNTWGAYQCYGNPDFKLRLPSGETPASIWLEPSTKREAKDQLGMLQEDTREGQRSQQISVQLTNLQNSLSPDWLDGEMLSLLGDRWASLGNFDRAIDLYRQAKRHKSGLVSLSTLQGFANLLVRSVTSKDQPSLSAEKIRERFEEAERLLQTLSDLNQTPETLALIGSLHKRWARLEKSSKSRQAKLRQAADQYRKAYDLSKEGSEQGDPYPGLNWLSCEYVIRELSPQSRQPSGDGAEPAFAKELGEIHQTALKTSQSDNIWKRLHTPDADLLAALFEGRLNGDVVSKIQERYREAIGGRADQKEINSVRDQFDFFLEMLPGNWKGGREHLSTIQQSISA